MVPLPAYPLLSRGELIAIRIGVVCALGLVVLVLVSLLGVLQGPEHEIPAPAGPRLPHEGIGKVSLSISLPHADERGTRWTT